VPATERVLLQDKGMSGWQDFFNDISVRIVAKLFVSQLYQPFFDQLLNDFSRKSALAHGWPYSKIHYIPKAD
jgi:hypothetical protein